ncbi:hypothetical protein [Williamsia soli]|uniref:hypothetical protein n=1 Tax=Williamsia soli TaxID=364929 RepID=UPI001A9E0740|nr:hypothetical protein [Williamsia soli]
MAKKSIESLMTAGTRGELLSSWPIVQSARKNDAGIVIGVYAAATLISLVISVFVYSANDALLLDLFMYAAWAGLAYFFIAIGTKLSHNMAVWGIALVGGVLAVIKVIGAIIGAATINTANRILDGTDIDVPGTGTYVFRMFVFAAIAAGCIYAVVKMNRGIQASTRMPRATMQQDERPQ